MSIFAIPLAAIIFGTIMIMVISIAGAQSRQRQAQIRADVQMKLIDRFGSANEFVEFVKSEEGKRFLGNPPQVARSASVAGLRIGIILGCLGLGFAVLGGIEDRGWFIPAFIVLGLGVGFFASAMVSAKVARDMERNVGS